MAVPAREAKILALLFQDQGEYPEMRRGARAWGSLGVALGWLWGAYQLPINRPCGGFGVAWAPSHESRITHHSWLWGGLQVLQHFSRASRLS